MVTPRYKKDIRGGGELSCALLVEALRKQGIEVDVLAGDELFPSIKNTGKLNIEMYKVSKKLTNAYDIWHFYNMSLLPMGGLLTRKYNINSVASLNGHNFSPTLAAELSDHPTKNYLISLFLLKSMVRHIKKFTTLGEYWKEAWVRDGIPQGKIQVIPNMIDKSYVAEKPFHRKKVNIVAVGNYAKWRNMKMLLDAYSKLSKQDICFSIIGQGWEKDVMNYKGENTVVYYRQMAHEKVKEMYALADIYVQSFKYSGIGRSMLEACQNKTAIITTGRTQDFPYLFGYINYFANSDMLRLTLQTLINNKDLRDNQSEQVCRVVNKYFSSEFITKQYIKLYEGVLKC